MEKSIALPNFILSSIEERVIGISNPLFWQEHLRFCVEFNFEILKITYFIQLQQKLALKITNMHSSFSWATSLSTMNFYRDIQKINFW